MLVLEEEGGITSRSLENAERLLQEYGRPSYLSFFQTKKNWHCVQATWLFDEQVIEHIFTGFAWGYGGEGPRGLQQFFRMLDIKIKLEQIATWKDKGYVMIDVPELPLNARRI